jgi:hypothetical protein
MMTVKELIQKLKSVPQETKVQLLSSYYRSCEDSVSSYEQDDLEGVYFDKKYNNIVLTIESCIGYPLDDTDYEKIN